MSKVAPYQPTKPLITPGASVERMNSILAKHAKVERGTAATLVETVSGSVPAQVGDRLTAGQDALNVPIGVRVPVPEPLLHWAKPENATLRSTCGRYCINKIMVGAFTTYELWKMVPSGNWFSVLRQGMGTSAEAKALAEAHLQANP